uniref:Uncharacterized protein n=1 Tax=Micrurus surinamensis TaxID=129470 RepID=A0A2D4Q6I6_MICSU
MRRIEGTQEGEEWKGEKEEEEEEKSKEEKSEEIVPNIAKYNFLKHIRLLISPHPLLYLSKSQVSSKEASKAVPRPPNSCACQYRNSSGEQVTCPHRNTCDSGAPKPIVPEDYLQAVGGHPAFFTSVEVFDQPFR